MSSLIMSSLIITAVHAEQAGLDPDILKEHVE
jgi:hypothetical protein